MSEKYYSATAWLGNQKIAQTRQAIFLEGNYYFPIEDVTEGILSESPSIYHCHWKGKANYKNITINDQNLTDAAWIYLNPFDEAKMIQNKVAFDKAQGIKIVVDEER